VSSPASEGPAPTSQTFPVFCILLSPILTDGAAQKAALELDSQRFSQLACAVNGANHAVDHTDILTFVTVQSGQQHLLSMHLCIGSNRRGAAAVQRAHKGALALGLDAGDRVIHAGQPGNVLTGASLYCKDALTCR